MRILLVHPGATWSTADVYDGLLYGLRQLGADVVQYRLDTAIEMQHKALHVFWRAKKKSDPTLPKPNQADVIYHAGVGALESALRHRADVVLIVSAMFLHPDVIAMMKQAGLRVAVLFTESPYDHLQEERVAAMVDGCWTNERTTVPLFRSTNPRIGYLPHAWHPQKHFVSARSIADVPQHDVVFVGTGFPERIEWFNSINWSGIDLGLYGTWKNLGLKRELKDCIKRDNVDNAFAASLYRRAKIGLNLYRTRGGNRLPPPCIPESLSPRAYELAACGSFHLSDYRAEVAEIFGELVPTFRTPTEAAALIRRWLADDEGRKRIAAQLPAAVAEASWTTRAQTVLGDLHALLSPATATGGGVAA
jgi:spore maturation protein CgeB